MKKLVQSIIILIAAVAVFFTGTGVTIVDYCCSGCVVEQTLVMTKAHTCGMQKTGETEPSCCSSHTQPQACDSGYSISDNGHCKASRLSADIDGSVFRPHVSSPFVWISDLEPVSQVATSSQTEDIANFIQFEPPPNILPREYLSLIRVLII